MNLLKDRFVDLAVMLLLCLVCFSLYEGGYNFLAGFMFGASWQLSKHMGQKL